MTESSLQGGALWTRSLLGAVLTLGHGKERINFRATAAVLRGQGAGLSSLLLGSSCLKAGSGPLGSSVDIGPLEEPRSGSSCPAAKQTP